jgi:hypothetical protein
MITPMPEDLHLPELARSLRVFGAAHGAAAESAHAAVFGPLLDARVLAATDGFVGALSAFRGQALGARIVARAADAAREGELDPARARARVAQAREAVEPLRTALRELDALAPAPSAVVRSSPQGAAWLAQLTCVFRSADDVCMALARVLGEPVSGATRGWFGRRRR